MKIIVHKYTCDSCGADMGEKPTATVHGELIIGDRRTGVFVDENDPLHFCGADCLVEHLRVRINDLGLFPRPDGRRMGAARWSLPEGEGG